MLLLNAKQSVNRSVHKVHSLHWTQKAPKYYTQARAPSCNKSIHLPAPLFPHLHLRTR